MNCKGKFFIFHWINAHVNNEDNECTNSLTKEVQISILSSPTIALADANVVAQCKFFTELRKK